MSNRRDGGFHPAFHPSGVYYSDTFTLPTYKTGDLDYVPEPDASIALACGATFLAALGRLRRRAVRAHRA